MNQKMQVLLELIDCDHIRYWCYNETGELLETGNGDTPVVERVFRHYFFTHIAGECVDCAAILGENSCARAFFHHRAASGPYRTDLQGDLLCKLFDLLS